MKATIILVPRGQLSFIGEVQKGPTELAPVADSGAPGTTFFLELAGRGVDVSARGCSVDAQREYQVRTRLPFLKRRCSMSLMLLLRLPQTGLNRTRRCRAS